MKIDLDILTAITERLRRANDTARRPAGPDRPQPPLSTGTPSLPLARRIRHAR
ncbi:hypothetical protein ACWT_2590 [Actinoplanes sp. SE50]|uniref:hypothetical protein n=1 Tax=unclassified Actinoplanes TaxID=2626549 RepID=UPI00023ED04D|nr:MULTISPECIES: hypothetical protein [unclassified Actinoplanes]AEV83851.1 hypothetical protein ACPL_2956 [Actinoplanes sp. SE50/110]ATO82005.1 hypothetical protein ACWT_2590 [Actinoplanes sp. SE50]SLL99413.1 hypothetical protein ACSP50_2644 [Actinoplanes sp. SE50/110]